LKIIDTIRDYQKQGKPFYSFEFFPPKTSPGLHNLYARIDHMAGMEPAFVDVTWGAGGSTSEMSLEISENVQKYMGLNVMMHLTCTNMPKEKLKTTLDKAKKMGMRNILALRGDPPAGQENFEKCNEGFSYGSDLVKYIRDNYGDTFSIGVGAYPEGHLEAESKEKDIENLKLKVDAGADFIITQLFYDMDEYFAFLERCSAAGITCPIIPGLLPIQNVDTFKRFVEFTKIKVPRKILDDLHALKQDDEAVKRYGVDLCVSMCQQLQERGNLGFHFYSLNLEKSVRAILEKLNFVDTKVGRRTLPWRPSILPNRTQEDVRPIFWSNRPKSYISRTGQWDEFPNGRWGDSRSPAFDSLNNYYLLSRGMGMTAKNEKLLKEIGEPRKEQDIFDIFTNYCKGNLKRLPWCESELHLETDRISKDLVRLNQNGILTINSQPAVNGVDSLDPEVGWGGPGGRVYQKAYVEFFISPKKFAILLQHLELFDTISFQSINHNGECKTNFPGRNVNAVTWGVFPGKEIVQPTIVDYESFLIWKDEAYGLWINEWANLYSSDSPARKVIQNIHDTYYLVNLVENNYFNGDIFKVFDHPELISTDSAHIELVI